MKCKVCVITFLIVITDPYKGIDYSKPNTYTLNKECKKDCILEVIEPEKEAEKEIATEDVENDVNEPVYFFSPYLFL